MPIKTRYARSVSRRNRSGAVRAGVAKKRNMTTEVAYNITPRKQNSGKLIATSGDIGSKIIIGMSEDAPIFVVGE